MNQTSPKNSSLSPKWGPTAKMLVGLVYVAIFLALLVFSRSFIGPLLIAFILTYLLHPAAVYMSKITRLKWRASVNLIYAFLVIVLVATFTLTGLALFQQILNLIKQLEGFITQLPDLLANLSTQGFSLGPFRLDFSQFDLGTLGERVLGYVQPVLGRVGGLVGTFATSAVTTIGWMLLILLISYFFLADASQVPGELLYVEIPGYSADMRRLGIELNRIWNSFLRGQMIVFVLVIIIYTIFLTALGVSYSYAIAFLAGLARFMPYLGPFVTWSTLALVTYFQGGNYLHLQPLHYMLLNIGIAILLDQIFDNFVSPRVMGRALGLNPAAVLITALILTNLIGLIGLLMAAPVLATLKLLGQYTSRKLLDLDPWPKIEAEERVGVYRAPPEILRRFRIWLQFIREKLIPRS